VAWWLSAPALEQISHPATICQQARQVPGTAISGFGQKPGSGASIEENGTGPPIGPGVRLNGLDVDIEE
jgi:hypothetical protein